MGFVLCRQHTSSENSQCHVSCSSVLLCITLPPLASFTSLFSLFFLFLATSSIINSLPPIRSVQQSGITRGIDDGWIQVQLYLILYFNFLIFIFKENGIFPKQITANKLS